jgi:hypothetical protein
MFLTRRFHLSDGPTNSGRAVSVLNFFGLDLVKYWVEYWLRKRAVLVQSSQKSILSFIGWSQGHNRSLLFWFDLDRWCNNAKSRSTLTPNTRGSSYSFLLWISFYGVIHLLAATKSSFSFSILLVTLLGTMTWHSIFRWIPGAAAVTVHLINYRYLTPLPVNHWPWRTL